MPRVARRPKKFACTSCPKSFGGGGDLTRHYEGVHLKHKPHQCHFCESSFTQRSALKSHINTHTKKKPHKCHIVDCTSRFGDPSSRSRHMREAHGDDPSYLCTGFYPCQSSQKRKSSMKNHLKTKHHVNLSDEEMDALLISLQVPRAKAERTSPTNSDVDTPLAIKQHLSSPEPLESLESPLSQSSDILPEELSFHPAPTVQIQDMNYNPMYATAPSLLMGHGYGIASNHAFPRAAGMPGVGLRGAFAGGDDLAYGRHIAYQDSYPYIPLQNYLSASSRSSASASPLAMSPSPEPCLGFNPAAFSASSTSRGEQVYFDPRTAGADWTQPTDNITTFFYS